MNPAVSIILITKDRHNDALKCLESLHALDYPKNKLEIVVVEEGDAPQAIDGVKYIHIPRENRGWGYARNIGMKSAVYDLFAFTDDDCIVDREWLKKLVAVMEEKNAGGVVGGVLVKDSDAVGYCENVLGFPNGGLLRIHKADGIVQETKLLSTCNCIYRREVFEKVGYFFEGCNTRGTDMEFAQRATQSYKCYFVPDAIVYHKPRGSLWKIFLWFVDRGVADVRITRNLVERKGYLFFCLKNSMLLRILLLSIILYYIGSVRWYILVVLMVIYYLAILRRYAFQVEHLKRYDTLFLTPLVKFIMDIGTDCGRVLELSRLILGTKGK